MSADELRGVIEVAVKKAYPHALVYVDTDGAIVVLTEEFQTGVALLPVSVQVMWS